ncbi:FGGY-family carbohydrate kinase [bacterium]|nr:FGGY-family carbohydrate kinase [bacterium]
MELATSDVGAISLTPFSDDDSFVLAVDLGTSGCKTALIDMQGNLLAWEFEEVPLKVLPGGGAEQNPDHWWSGLVASTQRIWTAHPRAAERVFAVCISSQGEGTVAVDRAGRVLAPAILSMDMRGGPIIRKHVRGWLNIAGYDVARLPRWIRLTGGAPALSGKDPAAHMLFIRETMPDVYRQTDKFLNVLDYMNYRLTGRLVATADSILTSWVTDNRRPDRIRYDATLLSRSGIDPNKFPEIVSCTDVLGPLTPEAARELGLPRTTPVVAGAIDTTAAAIGSGAIGDGQAHLYIGTSSWLAAHIPFKKTDIFSSIASVPCAVPDRYLMIALQTTAGGNLSYLKNNILYHQDELLKESSAPDIYKVLDQIAQRVPAGSRGLLYLPWLYGERTPVDDAHLRAGLFGLSLEHTREDVIRAFYEGVALNTRWMLPAVTKFLDRPLDKLRLIGGGALSSVWCQIFADVLDVPIQPTAQPQQANALGAWGMAVFGMKRLSFEEVAKRIAVGTTFDPTPSRRTLYDERFRTFLELHRRLKPIYHRAAKATL